MEQSIVIQPLETGHAPVVAKIHIASQSGTFLTALGQDFLTVLYGQIGRSSYSDSYVALNNGQVIGFVVGALDTKKFFKDVAFNAPLRLGWFVFSRSAC